MKDTSVTHNTRVRSLPDKQHFGGRSQGPSAWTNLLTGRPCRVAESGCGPENHQGRLHSNICAGPTQQVACCRCALLLTRVRTVQRSATMLRPATLFQPYCRRCRPRLDMQLAPSSGNCISALHIAMCGGQALNCVLNRMLHPAVQQHMRVLQLIVCRARARWFPWPPH